MKKVLLILIGIICISLLLLNACSQKTTTTTPATTPTTSVTATGPKHGGTLRVGMLVDALTFNPPDMRAWQDFAIGFLPYETFGRFDQSYTYQPWLAEKWVEDPAAKTVTFSLKKGVKFQDGTDFNAEAAKWNIDNYIAVKKVSATSVVVVDNYTVLVNMAQWDNSLTWQILDNVRIYSPTAFKAHDADWAATNPVGSGPYKLVSWQRDVKSVWERWDGYWQTGKPYLDRIEIHIIADPTVAEAALKNGEIDILRGVPTSDVAGLAADGRFTIMSLKSGMGNGVDLLIGDSGHADSPFADVRVRKAVTAAIDSTAISKAVYQGLAQPTNQWAGPNMWAYNPNVVGQPYNPETAKSLLAEAGYNQTTHRLATTIYTQSDPNYIATATAVQSQLKAVGIDAKIDSMDFSKLDAMFVQTGWTQGLALAPLISGYDPAYLGQPVMLMPTAFLCGGSMTHPDEITAFIPQVLAAPDFATKKTMTYQLDSLMIDKYQLITPLFMWPSMAAKFNYVKDDTTLAYELKEWYPENIWLDK